MNTIKNAFSHTFDADYDYIEDELLIGKNGECFSDPSLCTPLSDLMPPEEFLDLMTRVLVAKHSNTIREFMKAFGLKNVESLSTYCFIPIEDVRSLLEDDAMFLKMKKSLTYMMVCGLALSSRMYRYEVQDEARDLLERIKELHQDCEKFFETEGIL